MLEACGVQATKQCVVVVQAPHVLFPLSFAVAKRADHDLNDVVVLGQ